MFYVLIKHKSKYVAFIVVLFLGDERQFIWSQKIGQNKVNVECKYLAMAELICQFLWNIHRAVQKRKA